LPFCYGNATIIVHQWLWLQIIDVFLVLWFLHILISKLIYLWNLVPGDVIIETYIESSVAVPTGKVREFDVVWKVVTVLSVACNFHAR